MSALDDRDEMIRSGCRLLVEIKRNGGTAKEVAELLRASPTRISHWGSNDPERIRKVGAPTNVELSQMASYLSYLVRRNLEGLQDLVVGGLLCHWQQMQLLTGLNEVFRRHAERWESIRSSKSASVHEMADMLKALQEKQAADGANLSIWKEMFGRFGGEPFMEGNPEADSMAMQLDTEALKKYLDPSPEHIQMLQASVDFFMEQKESQTETDPDQ